MAHNGIIKLYQKLITVPKSHPVLKINEKTPEFLTNIQYLSPCFVGRGWGY